MRILIRTSRTARWARRIASFAVPLAVLPVLMHRLGLIASETFHIIELIALGVAILGAVVGVMALARLWQTGDRGWTKAITGFLMSVLCMLPFAYGFLLYQRSPMVTDISTGEPLPLQAGVAPPEQTEEERKAVTSAFPNVRTRIYPLDPQQMFSLIVSQIAERGWEVLARQDPDTTGSGNINAVDTTLLGWRDEVAIRVTGDAEGSSVDMRSASLFRGVSDLGANGNRIEEFLTALDTEVTLLLRNNPTITAPAEPEPEEPVPQEGEAAG